MKPKSESSKVNSKTNSVLIWQEKPLVPNGKPAKLIDLDLYRSRQEPLSEATIQSWSLPVEGVVNPVKLVMISSGFSNRGLSGSPIQSMAA